MAATFVKKSGSFYLRLTGSTTAVTFAAASGASNTYKFYVNGGLVVEKLYDDAGQIYCTFNANPKPSGATIANTRFPGATVQRNYSGSGIRDLPISFTVAGSVPSADFYLGGSSLNWGTNLYAYPGSGFITNQRGIGLKVNGSWQNAGNIFIKSENIWRECITAWVRTDIGWRQMYQNYGNSSWINMLEGTDDALDFAVQVYALN